MSANSPNPLVPQGSLQQQTGTAKSKVRLAVFSIIAVHAVLFVGVLMQGGCKKDETKAPDSAMGQPAVPPDPFYSDPSVLTPSNVPPSPEVAITPTTPAPVNDPFSTPPTPGTPAPTISTSPSAPPAVVDMGLPSITSPTMSEPAPSVQQYTIAKNDNFYTIAKKLNTTAKKIIDANPNVDPARLQIGQKINVPVSATPMPASVESSAFPAPGSGGTTLINYQVRSGDTLYGIARKHGTTIKAIQAASGLKTTRIIVGQTLKVPSKAAPAPAPEPVISAPASTPTAPPAIPVIPGTNN